MRQWKACSQGRMTTPDAFGDEFEAVHGLADEVGGFVAGVGDVVHAEEVRWVDHGAEDVAVVGHADDVLSGVGKVDLALPGHHAEDVEAQQDARGVEFGVGFFQEGGDDVGALRAAGSGGACAGAVPPGLVSFFFCYPGLTSRAIECRPFGAGVG